MDAIVNILINVSSCTCLLLCDVIRGILKEMIDLVNYLIILGKSYLCSCFNKDIKPPCSHSKRNLENKYETEKYVALKSDRMISIGNK